MLLLCLFLIHRIRLHIIVEHFSVLLLLLLDVVQHLANILIGELKHAGVVQPGNVLFATQRVGTQITVVLLFLTVAVVGGGKRGLPAEDL